uniref:tRNA-2-methylthio-N(6)-dimethylallyladenosine synthase n=1 Tax=Schlesneria paludicola TaxID=360056 RepID=A0A7C4QSI5_9PLAN
MAATSRHKLFIETVGCQMNMLDSELVVAALRKSGYELTADIAAADTILFNTCSVREHAEHKIYSALGRLKYRKQSQGDLVIGVMGCMAQKDQELIFQRAPHVDLVVGTGQLAEIPRLLEEARATRRKSLAVSLDRRDGTRREVSASFQSYDPLREPEMRPSPAQAFVRIMFGCDKFCTYCVVPMTRGPEQSRAPAEIVRECRLLAEQGVKEVTLLGQTVNSYRFVQDGRTWRLSDLLESLHAIEGLVRLKFVTNYPRDMTDDLLEAVRDLPKCAQYLHVPAQSGSDDVLKRMKRGYTVGEYRDMFARIRAVLPEAAVSSDFIVGFCGETETAHQQSLDLIRECRFKNSFIFKYSPRPGTKAHSLLADDVPEDVKRRRNNELLALQNQISAEDNAQLIGRTMEVLVEGLSRTAEKQGNGSATSGPVQLTGRTKCDRIVVFDGNPRLAGSLARIRIEDCTATTLLGSIETREFQHGSSPLLPILA